MLRIRLNDIISELYLFNRNDSLTEHDYRAYAKLLVEEVVDAHNKPDDEGYIWDVIAKYERLLKGNINVEPVASLIYSEIEQYKRTHHFDPRLKLKVDERYLLKELPILIVVMDLDATLEAEYKNYDNADETDPDEMVRENPTAEEFALLEKTRK